jgi:hypothetical protein
MARQSVSRRRGDSHLNKTLLSDAICQGVGTATASDSSKLKLRSLDPSALYAPQSRGFSRPVRSSTGFLIQSLIHCSSYFRITYCVERVYRDSRTLIDARVKSTSTFNVLESMSCPYVSFHHPELDRSLAMSLVEQGWCGKMSA